MNASIARLQVDASAGLELNNRESMINSLPSLLYIKNKLSVVLIYVVIRGKLIRTEYLNERIYL